MKWRAEPRQWEALVRSHAESGECLAPPWWMGRWSAPVSSLPGKAVRWSSRSCPGHDSRGFPAFKGQVGMMTEFFQIARMSIPATETERLKSSVRKAKSCAPRWWWLWRSLIRLLRVVLGGVGQNRPGLWSRSRWSRMFSAGVGVGSRSRVFKTAGVGVGFLKLLESESVF